MRRVFAILLALASAGLPPAQAQAQERKNFFDDPLLPVTAGLAACPAPRPPGMTEQERREAAHVRAQHGNSCYRSGRCRLPNSYLYDKDIIPRVQLYLRQDGRFSDTSVWVQGERRLVFLMGCVRTAEQARQMERAVMLVDDVMGVVNLLMVGTQGQPRYPLP